MAMIIYGTHVFPKFAGYFGEKELCPNCQRTYKPAYTKCSVWAHIYYIPLFPISSYYLKMCPICGMTDKLKKKDAMVEISKPSDGVQQQFQYYAKHILANKPTKMLEVDKSYEFWVKDLLSNEEVCVAAGITKDMVKSLKKKFCVKDISIMDV